MLNPSSYEGIGWLVVALASLCVAINQIDDFFERRKPRPGFPPAEQLENSQKTLAARVDKLESAFAELRREMKEDRLAINESSAACANNIYRKIDQVRAELTASLEQTRLQLAEQQRLLPNEIVALLKNTNAI